MNAKEKAKELVDKFQKYSDSATIGCGVVRFEKWKRLKSAKQCATACVEEILKVNQDAWSRIPDIGKFEDYIPYQYWQKVLTEIQNVKMKPLFRRIDKTIPCNT